MIVTKELYIEWMKLPDWTILTDPDTHDLENSKNEFYYTSRLYAKTPYGIAFVEEKEVVNGASIPWFVQWYIPKSGAYNRSAGFHDSGYQSGGFKILFLNLDGLFTETFIKLTQKQVDNAYLKFMQLRKVKESNRKAQYIGLRLLGWIKWNKYRKQDKIKKGVK